MGLPRSSVDNIQYAGLAADINEFRTRTLGLPRLRFGDLGAHLLNDLQVPFIKMWSPNFVPKPLDWGAHVDVVGAFFVDQQGASSGFAPDPHLVAWLAEGDKPIFVGFGSMVIDDTEALARLRVGVEVDHVRLEGRLRRSELAIVGWSGRGGRRGDAAAGQLAERAGAHRARREHLGVLDRCR